MALDVGMDHPEWWDEVLAEIRQTGKSGKALESRGLTHYDAEYVYTQWPSRREEWMQAINEGKFADYISALPEIESQIMTGVDPVTAAKNCGLNRRRWYYVLEHKPGAKERIQQLREERQAVEWLIEALRDETNETSDVVAIVALKALRDIVEAAHNPDASIGSVRFYINRAAGQVLAHRDDMPANVRWALGLKDEDEEEE